MTFTSRLGQQFRRVLHDSLAAGRRGVRVRTSRATNIVVARNVGQSGTASASARQSSAANDAVSEAPRATEREAAPSRRKGE